MSVDGINPGAVADQSLKPAELIARWDVEAAAEDERSILSKLCGECIALFKTLLVSPRVKDRAAPFVFRSLDRSRCTLSLWDDAYRVTEGGLDEATEGSRYLRRNVLKLLSSVASTLSERWSLLVSKRVLTDFVQ